MTKVLIITEADWDTGERVHLVLLVRLIVSTAQVDLRRRTNSAW